MKQNSQQYQHPLTRKEVANILNFRSAEQVARNESNLGLKDCRADVNKRVVVYHHEKAVLALKLRGLL